MTGPLYERDMGKLPGTQKAHTIPSAYWKVIFINNSPAVNHYAAFLFDQNTPKGADFCQFRVTVDEIEKRTGLIIWAGLPDDVQASLKSKPGVLPELMGCKTDEKTRLGGFIFIRAPAVYSVSAFCAAANSRCRGDATA